MTRPLRIQVFQHVPFEGIAAIQPWAESRGHKISYCRLFAGELPPAVEEYDWLIVMGGPMGVHDEAEFPWLIAEKQALKAAVQAERPLLGICLGAQLLAHVLGAKVGKNSHKEIGWHPINALTAADASWPRKIFPDRLNTFHWHGDTFALPSEAILLAESEGCHQQAFALGERVVGLQFHPEVTEESIAALVANCAADITPGKYVHPADKLVGRPEDFTANRKFLGNLLAGLEARA